MPTSPPAVNALPPPTSSVSHCRPPGSVGGYIPRGAGATITEAARSQPEQPGMSRVNARFVVPILLLAACSRTSRPVPPLKPEPSVPPVTPVQPQPSAESALAVVRDTMVSYLVPAFGPLPI